MAVIGFVPVRGGSKSIPGKNIKSFYGKPLIYWVLRSLQDCEEVDRIVLATDAVEIENTALNFGFNKVEIYRRLDANAQDVSSTESVMLEYLRHESTEVNNEDLFILAQATSPFTTSEDFKNAIQLYKSDANCNGLLSCAVFKRFIWKDNLPQNYDFRFRPRRQDFKGSLIENGAIYISSVAKIIETQCRISEPVLVYEMPEHTSLELDEPTDWLIGENLMKKYAESHNELPTIKLFVSDVDGVLTDAGMYYSENGDELKKFNTRDGKAFEILRNNGIKTALVTSENTQIVKNRGNKLKIDYVVQGASGDGKLKAILEICEKEGIELKNVSYIGDDINCLSALQNVGLAACPFDAEQKVKNVPGIHILSKLGGQGVVRELVNLLIP